MSVWKVKVKSLSHVRLFQTSWTVAHQAPPSMGFSRQEYWSGLPFPSPGDLPDPGIESRSPTLRADSLPSKPPGNPYMCVCVCVYIYMCIYICLNIYMYIYLSESHSVMFNFLQPHGLGPISLLCPWNSPGKNTGVGSLSLLQGIFPTQGSNRGLLHCRQILYQLSYLHIDLKILYWKWNIALCLWIHMCTIYLCVEFLEDSQQILVKLLKIMFSLCW